MADGRNDLTAPLTKLCLTLEALRRTDEARVRTSEEFLGHFFPHDEARASDKLFVHLPKDVRGPILTGWGIRGKKAALRDGDDKVLAVVHDALVAGDLDHATVEQTIDAELAIRWLPLAEWWTFWRGGRLGKRAIGAMLVTGYDLGLFDAEWFLGACQSGELRATDVLSLGLSKDDLVRWMRAVHQGGDGSPKGLVAALGWETIVAKTDDVLLLGVIDALATKTGLSAGSSLSIPPPVVAPATERRIEAQPSEPEPKVDTEPRAKREQPSQREITRRPEPARPPEPSLKPGSRASARPPAIPVELEEPQEVRRTRPGTHDDPTDVYRTDEFPQADADALRRLSKA
jgi:hypothetical protein